jgi:hypothetical protein
MQRAWSSNFYEVRTRTRNQSEVVMRTDCGKEGQLEPHEISDHGETVDTVDRCMVVERIDLCPSAQRVLYSILVEVDLYLD